MGAAGIAGDAEQQDLAGPLPRVGEAVAPRRATAANGMANPSPGQPSPSLATDANATVQDEEPEGHQGPGEAFGRAALITSMSIFFVLIFGLMVLDYVWAKQRKAASAASFPASS